MFLLANFIASTTPAQPSPAAMTSTGKKIIVVVKNCSDETASTVSSLSSDSIDRQAKHYVRKKKKEQHAASSNAAAAASSNDDDDMMTFFCKDEEQSEAAVNIPPMIAFQKFKLLELKRRCNGIYRRHQGRRRSRMSDLQKNQEYMNISEQQQQHGMIDEEYFV